MLFHCFSPLLVQWWNGTSSFSRFIFLDACHSSAASWTCELLHFSLKASHKVGVEEEEEEVFLQADVLRFSLPIIYIKNKERIYSTANLNIFQSTVWHWAC